MLNRPVALSIEAQLAIKNEAKMTNLTFQGISKFILIAVEATSNEVARYDLSQANQHILRKTDGYKFNVSVEQA